MQKINISLPKNKAAKNTEVNDSTSIEYHQRKNSISLSKTNNYINQTTLDQSNIKDSLHMSNLPHLNNKKMAEYIFSTPTSNRISKQVISEYKSPFPLKLKLKNKIDKIYKIKVPNSMDKNYINFK